MGRHPYTYAADLVRSWAGCDEFGDQFPRSSAAKVIEGFAMVLGVTREELSEKLSKFYQEHQQAISDQNIEDLKREFPLVARFKSDVELKIGDIKPGGIVIIEEDDYKGADHD